MEEWVLWNFTLAFSEGKQGQGLIQCIFFLIIFSPFAIMQWTHYFNHAAEMNQNTHLPTSPAETQGAEVSIV